MARIPISSPNSTAGASGASKLIAALDALQTVEVFKPDADNEMLRLGYASNEEGRVRGKGRQGTRDRHPFSRVSAAKTMCRNTVSKVSGSASSSPAIASISDLNKNARPSNLLALTPGTSKTKLAPSVVLPIYSYKDFTEHKPAMVFTQSEDEANDLVTSLKAG